MMLVCPGEGVGKHTTDEVVPKARMRRMLVKASSMPRSPETAASTRLPVSSCRTIRPALAPTAARRAISRARALLRASERLVTLAAAIRNTRNTAPPSIHSANRDCRPTMYWLTGTTVMPRLLSVAGR